METTNRSEEIAVLAKLIKDIRIAMLTTVDESGALHSRPMATQEVDFDGDLWFFTKDTSPKCREVVSHRDVNIGYVHPDQNRFISVSGRAQILFDRDKAEALWRPSYQTWFSEGLDDPHLALLKVEVTNAQYWESPGGPVKRILGAAKAFLNRTTYLPGEPVKIDLERKAV